MAENIQATQDEMIYVTSDKISCDGPKEDRHPRVFLTLKDGVVGEVVCPYCGAVFKKKSDV